MLETIDVILRTGGWILVPIALASVVALAVIIERCWRLLPMRRRFAAVRAECNEALLRGGAPAVMTHLDDHDALSRVWRAGLAAQDLGADGVRAMALDAAQREIPRLERGLGVVLAVSQVAPLLGLLGTVAGLLHAFQAASEAEAVTIKLLADGVYRALSTTAAGLFVAIPTFIAYVALSGVVARLADELEHAATDLPLLLRKVN